MLLLLLILFLPFLFVLSYCIRIINESITYWTMHKPIVQSEIKYNKFQIYRIECVEPFLVLRWHNAHEESTYHPNNWFSMLPKGMWEKKKVALRFSVGKWCSNMTISIEFDYELGITSSTNTLLYKTFSWKYQPNFCPLCMCDTRNHTVWEKGRVLNIISCDKNRVQFSKCLKHLQVCWANFLE